MIFRSPHPEVTVPEVSLPELILTRAEQHGDKLALINAPTGQGITFVELALQVRRIAAGLTESGFRKGDAMALACPNSIEYGLCFLAVASLGGVNTPLNPAATSAEIRTQAEDSGARYLLTTAERASKARKDTRWRQVFVDGEAPGTRPFRSLIDSSTEPPSTQIDPARDVVALPYSSGTTGLPKGVMLTHGNLVANLRQLGTRVFDSEDTILGLVPFHHIYGLTVVLHAGLYLGATNVILPRFEIQSFVEAIDRYGVTHANLVPPVILALAKHPGLDPKRLSSLRTVQSGAAPLPPRTAELFSERFQCRVMQGYGLTEASPVTHVAPRTATDIPIESIGPPLPSTECRILDVDDGTEKEIGSTGELYVRGPQVMEGYLNAPDKTREMLDPEGWLRTGDIARTDAQGNFYIVDRAKELIKYKAHAIAPAELEALLLEHPKVVDAAVIPSPDEAAGEVPKALVVPSEPVGRAELITWVAERVAPYKKIRILEFVDEIPKSPSGKILRRVLIERDR